MRYKRGLFITILLVLVVVALFFAFCCKKMPAKLSEMKDDDLIQYLADAGITYPDPSSVDLNTMREVFAAYENAPDYRLDVNLVLDEEVELVRNLLIGYESIANKWILFGRFVVG